MTDATPHEATVDVGGASIPTLGLGTWQLTGRACTEAVSTALELGYRHLDTAQVYGNEAEVGQGVAEADVDREEVFITTKVWRTNLRYDDVVDSTRESLDRLGVDSVDLLLVHWPHPRRPVAETLDAMTDLQDEGAVDHVGVANFIRSQLEAARRVADSPIVTDQVLYHSMKEQSALLEYCVDTDVSLTAYSPLARGGVVGNDALREIGVGYDKTPAQVALRWLVQQENVVAIPKASSQEHLEENLAIFDFGLTDEEMARIHDLKPGLRRSVVNRLPGLMRRNPLP